MEMIEIKELYAGILATTQKHYAPEDIQEIDSEIEEMILEVLNSGLTGSPRAYAKWLIHKVVKKMIKPEDIDHYKNYFKYFENAKRLNLSHFTHNDINKYTDKYMVEQFERESVESNHEFVKLTGVESISKDEQDYLVSLSQIKTLEKVGIVFLGITDGYQVFKIPTSVKDNEEAWLKYKNILGRCANQGAQSISMCTFASFNYFRSHLKDGDLFIFFNLKDQRSPYQFHYETNQFKDKDNISVA
jgi:hypothetical protein